MRLLDFLVSVFVKAGAPIGLAVDDTLFGRLRRRVFGAHYLHDGAQPGRPVAPLRWLIAGGPRGAQRSLTQSKGTSGMTKSTYDLPVHKRLAEDFHVLHEDGPIRLANAWNAGTAKLIAEAGATAIATTSGGASWSHGLPDGNSLTRDQALQNIASIVASVDLPVTADIETGYATTLDELTTTIRQVLGAGAVGINIEDSGGDPLYTLDEQADRIATVRKAADDYGVPLFINARTDVLLLAVGEEAGRFDEVIERAKAYAGAGANGVFVPGLLDLDALKTLADSVEIAVNAMWLPGAPTVDQLAEAGVKRVSLGTGLPQVAFSLAQAAARELFENGTYITLDGTIDYFTMNDKLT